jgi:hypothetical protein
MTAMRLRHRAAAILIALAVPPLGLLLPAPSRASVSIAVSWEGLLQESSSAAIATPFESRAVWENGRIYTYTHVRIDRSIIGDTATGGDAWVRTMGGIVGKIGQSVEGEAILSLGHSSLLFLRAGPVSSFEVTARGQGQFPVVAGSDPTQPAHVVRNNAVGLLLARRGPPATAPLAGEFLHGRSIDDAAREVNFAWGRTHAH